MNTTLTSLLTLGLLANLFLNTAQAAPTYTYNGSGTDWDTASVWTLSGGAIPGAPGTTSADVASIDLTGLIFDASDAAANFTKLTVGSNNIGNTSFSVTGSSLTTVTLYIGNPNGIGAFNGILTQSGGTVTTGTLNMYSDNAGTANTYALSGGTFNVGSANIGAAAIGVSPNSGTTLAKLLIDGSGIFNASGGLNLNGVMEIDTGGSAKIGTVGISAGRTLLLQGGSLSMLNTSSRFTVNNGGLVTGYGSISLTNQNQISGQIVATGSLSGGAYSDQTLTLQTSSFNSSLGSGGYAAQNHGELSFGAQTTTKAAQTLYFGTVAANFGTTNAPSNSFMMTTAPAIAAGVTAQISLEAADRTAVAGAIASGGIPTITGEKFVSLWNVTSSLATFSFSTLTLQYDPSQGTPDAFWYFTGGKWSEFSSTEFTLNTSADLVTLADPLGILSYSTGLYALTAAVPEPGSETLLGLAGAAAVLTALRRRLRAA